MDTPAAAVDYGCKVSTKHGAIHSQPRTLWVARTETTDGSAFFRTLSSLIEPHKDKLVTAANTALIPSNAEAAALQKETEADEILSAALSAKAEAIRKVAAYREWWDAQVEAGHDLPANDHAQGIDLYRVALEAQQKAQRMARQAGQEDLYVPQRDSAQDAKVFSSDGVFVKEPPASFKPGP